MIHFHEEKVALALKLIDEKSVYDDIKASNDMAEIDTMINSVKANAKFVGVAKMLDEIIQKDYPEIQVMHNIVSNMTRTANLWRATSLSEADAIISNLQSDRFGILASVLLKHGMISDVKDFIKTVD